MRKLPQTLLFLALCGLGASPALADDVDTSATRAETALPADAATESAQPAEPPVQASGWQFSASPYLWMAGLKGDMGVSEAVEPVAVDFSFGDLLSNLKFAAMGSFEARNGRFIGTGDIMYMSLGASDNIKIHEVDFVDVKLKSKTFIMTGTAGYRALDQGRLHFDLFGGGRLNAMKSSLDLEGPRRSFSGSKTETWIDPIVGARFQMPLGPKWTLQAYGDIGGFGIASHSTFQLLGTVQYDLSSRWSLSGGWRHLKTNYDHKGFVFDASMDGPILGAVYRF